MRRTLELSRGLLYGGLFLSWSVLGHAQAQSGRQALEVARTHMEQGQDLYAGGRYLEAAAEFLAAYRAREFSAFLYNAAMSYERYGDTGRAAEYFQRYLDREPSASDAGEVTARIARLRAATAATESAHPGVAPPTNAEATVQAGTSGAPSGTTATRTEGATTPVAPAAGTQEGAPATTGPAATAAAPAAPVDMKSLLSVQTEPEGARVTLKRGGEVVASGPSPFGHTVDEGEYQLFVEHPDFRTVEQNVRIRAGKVYVVFIGMSQAQFLGYLRVISDPPEARVYVDDHEAGSHPAPYRAEIPTGSHHVWVERPGYATFEQDVDVGLGEQVELRVELERSTNGRVRMIGNVRGAAVHVDGRLVGAIPYEGDLPAGMHRIRVSAPDMKDWEEEIEIHRGQVTPMRIRLRPAPDHANGVALVSMAALSLGTGIGFAVASSHLKSELRNEASQGTLVSDDPRFRRGRIYAITADASFGVAGLLGFLGIYSLAHDSTPDSEGTVLEPRDFTFAPSIDPVNRAASFTLERRF